MCGADGDQVGDVGAACESPEDDVMYLALFEGDLAAVADTGLVHRAELAALGPTDGTGRSTQVGDFAGTVEDVGDDVGVTAQSADLRDGYGDAVVGLTDAVFVQPVDQGGEVDEHTISGTRRSEGDPTVPVPSVSLVMAVLVVTARSMPLRNESTSNWFHGTPVLVSLARWRRNMSARALFSFAPRTGSSSMWVWCILVSRSVQ